MSFDLRINNCKAGLIQHAVNRWHQSKVPEVVDPTRSSRLMWCQRHGFAMASLSSEMCGILGSSCHTSPACAIFPGPDPSV